MMIRLIVSLVVVGLLAIAGSRLLPPEEHEDSTLVSANIKSLPDFSLPDLEGTSRNLLDWKGKVLVVNFWATWCPPCRKEMPTFIEIQTQHAGTDLQIVGIAVDDREVVQKFYEANGINFPILVGGNKAIELAGHLGNRFDGLPFTAVFDKSGKLHYFQTGRMTIIHFEQHVLPLL